MVLKVIKCFIIISNITLVTVRLWFCRVPLGTREVLDCVAFDADDVTDDFGVFKRPIRVLVLYFPRRKS
jgi:hypothetical protein